MDFAGFGNYERDMIVKKQEYEYRRMQAMGSPSPMGQGLVYKSETQETPNKKLLLLEDV